MHFPTTSALSNFSQMSNGGPPPNANYINGPYNSEGMVIESSRCVADPNNVSEMGNALWIANSFGPDFEAWITIDEVDADWAYVSLFLYNIPQTSGYIVTWLTANNSQINSITLYDDNLNIIWVSSIVPILANNAQFGFQTAEGNSLTIYTNTGTGWRELVTVNQLSIPSSGYIGFGAFAP